MLVFSLLCHQNLVKEQTLFSFIILTILIKLLGWHWLIRLYRVQVYHSITHHLYVALCALHPQSRLLLPPCIWPPLTSSNSPKSHSPLVTTIWLSLPMGHFVCSVHLLLSVLYPTCKWNYMVLDPLHLTYFTQHNTLKIHPYFQKSSTRYFIFTHR